MSDDDDPIEVVDASPEHVRYDADARAPLGGIAERQSRGHEQRERARALKRRGPLKITDADRRACPHSLHPRRTVAACSLCSEAAGIELPINRAARVGYLDESLAWTAAPNPSGKVRRNKVRS